MKKTLTMKQDSLCATQYLISQVLHDLISPFTSLAAGIDMMVLPQGEISQLVQLAKDQLFSYLVLYRFIFSQAEGTAEEATRLLYQYGKIIRIPMQGVISNFPKLTVAMALWLIKQCVNREQSLLRIDSSFLQLQSPLIKDTAQDEKILQEGISDISLKNSYVLYLYQLLHPRKMEIERTPSTLTLIIH